MHKTAYEMRISDWSSDVCSSDLSSSGWISGPWPMKSPNSVIASMLPPFDSSIARKRSPLAAFRPPCLRNQCAVSAASTSLQLSDRKRVEEGKGETVRVNTGGRRYDNKKTKHTDTSRMRKI